MDDWAGKIRALEKAGMTLTEIADRVGMSVSSVSDLKQGRAKAKNGMAYVRLHDLFLSVPAKKRKAA